MAFGGCALFLLDFTFPALGGVTHHLNTAHSGQPRGPSPRGGALEQKRGGGVCGGGGGAGAAVVRGLVRAAGDGAEAARVLPGAGRPRSSSLSTGVPGMVGQLAAKRIWGSMVL